MANATTRGARVPTDVFLPAAGTKPPSGAGSGKILGVNKWVFIGGVGVALVAAYLIYRHYQNSSSSSASTPAATDTDTTDPGLVGDPTGNGASGGATGTTPTGPPVTPAPAFDASGIGASLDAIYAELAAMQTGTSTAKTPAGSATGLGTAAGNATLAERQAVAVDTTRVGAAAAPPASAAQSLNDVSSGGPFTTPVHEAVSPRLAAKKAVPIPGTTSNKNAVQRSKTLH